MLYRLYGTGSNSTDSNAALDIREDGQLENVVITVSVVTAAAIRGTVEISFGSTGQFSTNDTTQVIATANFNSAIGNSSMNIVVPLPDVQVAAGERIYMHVQLSAAVTGYFCHAHINVRDKASRARPRR